MEEATGLFYEPDEWPSHVAKIEAEEHINERMSVLINFGIEPLLALEIAESSIRI